MKAKNNVPSSVFGDSPASDKRVEGSANWAEVNPGTIAKLVDVVTSRGGAVRFGYTRDGGAYAVGFYYGDESKTDYCRPSDDVEGFLERWIDFYEHLPYSGGKSPTYKR
jgi:hypothetical protein